MTAIGDGTISMATATGQTIDVGTTDTTTYHRQAPAAATDVAVGSSVRLTLSGGFGGQGGGFGGGQGVPAASAAPGAASATVTDVEVLLPVATTTQGNGTPQQGGFGGRRAGTTGTVTAIGDGSITITTSNGQTTQAAITDATTYHQQAAATAADVTVGSPIRVTVSGFGGFGGGQGGFGAQPGQGGVAASPAAGAAGPTISASDVESC